MPAVRCGPYRGPGEHPVHGELLPEPLLTFIAVDEEQGMWFITQKNLDKWGKTFDDLYPAALENLRRSSSPQTWESPDDPSAVQIYATGDGFDASRILILKDIVRPWPRAGVVVAIPSREILMCLRPESPSDLVELNWMLAMASDIYQNEGYSISGEALWFDGEEWMPIFQVEVDSEPVWMVPHELRERLETG